MDPRFGDHIKLLIWTGFICHFLIYVINVRTQTTNATVCGELGGFS